MVGPGGPDFQHAFDVIDGVDEVGFLPGNLLSNWSATALLLMLWLLKGRRILSMDTDKAVIETDSGSLVYRRVPTEPGQICVWELKENNLEQGHRTEVQTRSGRDNQ